MFFLQKSWTFFNTSRGFVDWNVLLINQKNIMKTKRFTFLFATLFSVITSQAQIPNASFENWATKTIQDKTVRNPVGWYTSNVTSVYFGEPEMAKQTADAYSGNSALMLVNYTNQLEMTANAQTINEISEDEFNEKFPLNNKVVSLKGYYKYDYTAESDSCQILIMLYRNGINIAYGEFSNGIKSNQYTAFEAPIQYFQDSIPDSASISIFASSNRFNDGTVLIIDDLSLTTQATSVAEHSINDIEASVYPNPVYGMAGIQFKQTQSGKTTIAVYNVLGNLVQQLATNEYYTVGNHNIDWETDRLPEGMYFVKITQNEASKTIKVLLK